MEYAVLSPEDIFKDQEVRAYIQQGNDNLGVIGFTEHGFAHAKRSSDTAREILTALGYPERTCQLAAIAGYMHDIGNNRQPGGPRPQRRSYGLHHPDETGHVPPGDRADLLGHRPPRRAHRLSGQPCGRGADSL